MKSRDGDFPRSAALSENIEPQRGVGLAGVEACSPG